MLVSNKMFDVPFINDFEERVFDARLKPLLKRINSNTEIQKYMDLVAIDIQSIIYCYSEHMYVGSHDKAHHCKNAFTYEMTIRKSFNIGTNENIENSGSVFSEDVLAVFTAGNIRERCTIFQNFLFKDRQNRIMTYLMNAYSRKMRIPMCINSNALGSVIKHISNHQKEIDQTPNLRHIICDTFKNKKRRTRCIRKNQKGFGILVENCVPGISDREYKLITSHQSMHNTMPWKTGRMTWIVNPNSMFAQEARSHHQDTIAGPSGHTHSMLCFMKLFTNFDLHKWVLICILWLVGCEHHSIYEVLIVAKTQHNMDFDPTQDCYEFVDTILNSISKM